MSSRAFIAFGFFAAAAGCAPSREPAFVRAVAVGDRAKTAGRDLEAASAYERAATQTTSARERDYALFLAATSFTSGDDRADAARIYESLAARPGEYAERAMFERAMLDLKGDVERGLDGLERFALEHPNHALARRAITLVAAARAPENPARAAFYERVLARVRGSELEEHVRYQLALAHAESGETERALGELLALADAFPYPKGGLWDNALYRASELAEKLGRYDEAVKILQRMLEERETTHLVGSYERPMYRPAAERIATLYRDRLGDLPRARDAFIRVFDEFEHSVHRDDALFEAALVAKRMNDTANVCRALDKLVRAAPESRYAPCAKQLCESIDVPKPAREKKCADYVIRKIEKGSATR